MQFWPRVKAKRIYPSIIIKKLPKVPAGVFGFAGYKAGMTQVLAIDSRRNSTTKGEEITIPVTVVECPPIKLIGIRFYRQGNYGLEAKKDILFSKDKHLERVLSIKKNITHDLSSVPPADFSSMTLIVATQPHLAGIAKKTPEIFELPIGGSVDDKKAFVDQHAGKEIPFQTVFKEGELVDIHSVSKGKGLQGPVKRFGVSLRSHKSEKTKRGPGSLGPWSGQAHIMYRVAHAGQMGFHTRTEYNKQIIKIGTSPQEVNAKGGFLNYGNVKSTFILIKGSVTGARKRLVVFSKPSRALMQIPVPTVQSINTNSKQG
jgi:large subunit ribosomal protein L3